jgi:hypothetical protein
MHDMQELIKAAGLAKTRIDAGFSRVGRRLSAAAAADRALMTLAARAVSTGNALTILCREGHANEALPLLRAIAGAAVSMRWIAAADSESRGGLTAAELARARWVDLAAEAPGRERAESFGVPAWAVAEAYDTGADFAGANAQGLPWGHTFAEGARAARKPETILSAAVVWLALAVEALDRRWPGDFPGAAEMRDAASISRG